MQGVQAHQPISLLLPFLAAKKSWRWMLWRQGQEGLGKCSAIRLSLLSTRPHSS